MKKQGILGSVTGEDGSRGSGYCCGLVTRYPEARHKGSSPLAEWERHFLEEVARIEEECKVSSDELDRGHGPVFVTRAASAAKVLAYEAELGARLAAVVPGQNDGAVGSWLYFR